MDIDFESTFGESSQSASLVRIRDSLAVNNSCAFCHRILSSDTDADELEAINVCGDCKFMLLEDIETTSSDVYPRRHTSRRRYDSSESFESMFSQQFSQMINLARQNQSTVFERDSHSVDGDGAAMLERHTSSRTTPSGSTRWRRGFSDAESDGFDSLYGESESNASFRRYRVINGDSDIISYSAYGEDSDTSIDGRSFFENENFGHLNGESEADSDTDIDPMNAGLYQWDSEDEEEDVSEWEEADIDRNTLEPLRDGAQPQGSLISNGSNVFINWRRQSLSPSIHGPFPLRRRERMNNFQEAHNYAGEFGDYYEARSFGDLLQHLVETGIYCLEPPATSVSFVNNLPRITLKEDKLDGMACAICKDSFTLGTVVNQLPCFHLYHPPCISPWLSARNTCPLCRYELPTDDKDYEARNVGDEIQTFHIHHQPDTNSDSSLDATYDVVVDESSQLDHGGQQELANANSARENGDRDIPRHRWFFLAAAAAPIVSVVGISLMLWFGNPSAGRLCRNGGIPYRSENGQRRWWSFF